DCPMLAGATAWGCDIAEHRRRCAQIRAAKPTGCRDPRMVPGVLMVVFACTGTPARSEEPADPWAQRRAALIDSIVARGIRDEHLLAAMRRVPRHEFVPPELRAHASDDRPLPIGFDQTISQPSVVAAMTEAARIAPHARVLEIGTGSGYQAAILVALDADVYSIEIIEPLARRTHALLSRLGYRLHLRIGDG